METSITINNLSQAEIELIAKAREEQLQKQKEIQEANQAKIEKANISVDKRYQHTLKQIAAAHEYYKQFDQNLYSFVLQDKLIEESVYGEDRSYGPIHVVSKQTHVAYIVRNDVSDVKISIEERFVYRSTWDVRGTSKGFEMSYTDNNYKTKFYKKVQTLHTNIQNAIDAKIEKQLSELRKKNAVDANVEMLKDKYPSALVVSTVDYVNYGTGRSSGYTKYNVIEVTFANGVVVRNRVWEDGKLSLIKTVFPNSGVDNIMDKLSKLSF